MRPLRKRKVEAGIVDRDQEIDVLTQDELPDVPPQTQDVGKVTYDLGKPEDRQPIEPGEQLDAGISHLASTEAGEPNTWNPSPQSPGQLRSVLVTRRLAG